MDEIWLKKKKLLLPYVINERIKTFYQKPVQMPYVLYTKSSIHYRDTHMLLWSNITRLDYVSGIWFDGKTNTDAWKNATVSNFSLLPRSYCFHLKFFIKQKTCALSLLLSFSSIINRSISLFFLFFFLFVSLALFS